MSAYYNEVDPFCAQWLRNLIARGLIAPGEVDERDIREVKASDLRGFTQCHFFAGIAGWSYALRLAGWSDDRPVWTGSCPCQPFSAAGKQKGFADERHLWPVWFDLIRECKPNIIFGEQVASALAWLDLVSGNLEGEGYACGTAIVGAHSVGAAHIRQRLYWVADGSRDGRREERPDIRGNGEGDCPQGRSAGFVSGGSDIGLAVSHGRHTGSEGLQRSGEYRQRAPDSRSGIGPCGEIGNAQISSLADDDDPGRGLERCPELLHRERPAQRYYANGRSADGREFCVYCGAGIGEHARDGEGRCEQCCHLADRLRPRLEIVREQQARGECETVERGGASRSSPWHPSDWLPCRDGKSRPVEPGTFPLANGVPGRVGRLRAYGNAIVAPLAAAFITAALDCV